MYSVSQCVLNHALWGCSPFQLHCVSSAEVLARVEDEDRRDDFQDFDADPDYNDPIKRRSFQAPGNDVDMVSNMRRRVMAIIIINVIIII